MHRPPATRLRRALVALALIFGHGAANAAAAMPACALSRGLDEIAGEPAAQADTSAAQAIVPTRRTAPADARTAASQAAAGDTSVSEAATHDPGPDAPPASACAVTIFAAATPAGPAAPPELPREPAVNDGRFPPGTVTPPPFQPPRV